MFEWMKEYLRIPEKIWQAWSSQEAENRINQYNKDIWTSWCSSSFPKPLPTPVAQPIRTFIQPQKNTEKSAKEKAEKLLQEHLTDTQKSDLKEKGYFLVDVKGETYKIMRGQAGNVKLLDKDTRREIKSFCIHPRERIPDSDVMLAQKLLLESDIEKFYKIANITSYKPIQ